MQTKFFEQHKILGTTNQMPAKKRSKSPKRKRKSPARKKRCATTCKGAKTIKTRICPKKKRKPNAMARYMKTHKAKLRAEIDKYKRAHPGAKQTTIMKSVMAKNGAFMKGYYASRTRSAPVKRRSKSPRRRTRRKSA